MPGKAISRRRFVASLTLIGSALTLFGHRPSAGAKQKEASAAVKNMARGAVTRVGIALGAGGARGLAHIPMLEALDELGVRPHRIAGCSMGAVIGALYASGLSGRDIRKFIDRLVISGQESWPEALFRKDVLKWIDFIDPELGKGGIIDGENFIQYLHEAVPHTRFEELSIPLKVVAADFWRREEVVLESGRLLDAVKASMALPGLFAPVAMDGRVLVDGGTVNPVPYDLLMDDCDVVIAVDVMGQTSPDAGGLPSFFEAIFNAVHIMQRSIMVQKLRNRRPHIYVQPDITDVRMLEFYRAETIYRHAEAAKRGLKQQLEKRLI